MRRLSLLLSFIIMSLSAVNAQQTDNRQLLRDSINAYKVQGSAMNLQKILDGMQKKGGLNGIQEDRTLYGIQKMLARQSGIDALLPADVNLKSDELRTLLDFTKLSYRMNSPEFTMAYVMLGGIVTAAVLQGEEVDLSKFEIEEKELNALAEKYVSMINMHENLSKTMTTVVDMSPEFAGKSQEDKALIRQTLEKLADVITLGVKTTMGSFYTKDDLSNMIKLYEQVMADEAIKPYVDFDLNGFLNSLSGIAANMENTEALKKICNECSKSEVDYFHKLLYDMELPEVEILE